MPDVEPLAWDQHRTTWQDPLNALRVPARRAQRDLTPPVDVVVRVDWPRDGVELIEARAVAYTTRAVLCHWREPRLQVLGAWFPAADVRRAAEGWGRRGSNPRPED